MPEGSPAQVAQVPYYEPVKDQGAREQTTSSDPSRLALRRTTILNHLEVKKYIHLVIRTPSNHLQEVKEPATCNVYLILT